mmetsp:Transcript_25485/g.65546  ORF Transcript_25485/g.65546 Transcript_25485/m.65546 type:complete len:376 (-) Transcript_25485:140-1267(-)
MQATPMVVSRSMKGDSVATVAVLGRLSSLAALVEFVLNPVFANLSDAYGRKVFLLLAPASTIVMRGAVARFPGVTTVGAGRIVTGALVPAFFTASAAALSDMYASSSPQDLVAVQGNLQMLMGGSFIISGLLAGKLAARNIRLPFLVSVALGAISLGVVLKGFRETLGKEDRRQASLRGANPLGFLRLFQGSTALARTSMLQGLSQFPVVLQDVDAAFGAKHRGWGPEDNGRFVAGAGVLSTVTGRCTGQIVACLGGRSHAVLAHISSSVSYLLSVFSTSSESAWLAVLVGALGQTRAVAVSVLGARLGQAEQMGRGEHAGAVANMNAVVKTVAPLIYSRLFAIADGLPYSASAAIMLWCAAVAASVDKRHWSGD